MAVDDKQCGADQYRDGRDDESVSLFGHSPRLADSGELRQLRPRKNEKSRLYIGYVKSVVTRISINDPDKLKRSCRFFFT
jgi:hypothetical protein